MLVRHRLQVLRRRHELLHQLDVVIVAVVVAREGGLLHQDRLLDVYSVCERVVAGLVLGGGGPRAVPFLWLSVAAVLLALAGGAALRLPEGTHGFGQLALAVEVLATQQKVVNVT